MILKSKLAKISPLSVGLVLVFAGFMTYILSLTFAASGTATLYTSPGGSQTVVQNNNFTVSARISTGTNVPVTGGEIYMTYPADKLQVASISYSGSPYNIQLEENNSAGTLKMVRAAFPAISGGDKLFAQVTFKAIASGTAEINFSANSKVTSGEDDSNILATRNGVSYTITSQSHPPSGASPPTAPAPSNSSQPSNSAPSSQKSTAPSTSGSTEATQPGSSNSTQGTSPLQVNEAASTGGEIPQAFYPVDVLVVNQHKKPVEGAGVSLNQQTSVTKENGIAQFTSIPVGSHKLKVAYKNKTSEKDIVITPSTDTAKPQFFTSEINTSAFNMVYLLLPLPLILIGALYFLRPRLSQLLASIPGLSLLNTKTKNQYVPPPPPSLSSTPPPSTAGTANPTEFHSVSDAIRVPVQPPGGVVSPTHMPDKPDNTDKNSN